MDNVIIKDTNEFFKTRHIFGLMGFLGFAVVYAMRVNLSVAIVAMVNQTAIPLEVNTELDTTCHQDYDTNSSVSSAAKRQREGDFAWDEAKQGIVLGSFFYGYVLTQVPGGRMAELMGGKRIYGYGVLITVIFTFLTPIAAYVGFPLLVLVRVLEGMGEGVTYPAMHAMLAHWIPPLERNKFAAIVYAGSNIGTVISMPLTGWLCSLEFAGGWPLAFYIFGFLGGIWFIFWMLLVSDTPAQHPRISSTERQYLQQCMGASSRASSTHIPWRSIFTSLPVWAILITQCGQGWAFYTQLTELPTYMSNILHYDIQSNAWLNALPYLSAWIVGIACSTLADYMLKHEYISLLSSYKLWNSVASVGTSVALIGIAYIGCDWRWVSFFLIVVGSLGGTIYSGNLMNLVTLSPQFAGTLYGLTNAAANICGFAAPYVIGLIINHRDTMGQWRIVFWLACCINMAGNFFYLIFAKGEEQSWSLQSR